MHGTLQDLNFKVVQIKDPKDLKHDYLITGVKREVVDTTRSNNELTKIFIAVNIVTLDNK